MLDEGHFPYQYQCDGCGALETVQHEDIQDVPTYFTTSTPTQAVEHVMQSRRGWSLKSEEGAYCPDCIDAASELA